MKDSFYLDPRVAEAYDADNATEAIVRDDAPFYLELAKEAAEAGLAVLELGCGTGRVTIPLAQAGVKAVGLDRSPAMLAVAERKAGFPHPFDKLRAGSNPLPKGEGTTSDNPRWVEGDMADFHMEERFGLVIIPWRSFLLLLSVAEQKSCLRCIHEHLVDGGRLALNFFNPGILIIGRWLTARPGTLEPLGSHIDPISQRRVEVWQNNRYLTSSQQLDHARVEEEMDDSGAIIARVERNLRARYVFRYEMEHLLALSGFEVEALYGWFDKRPFDDESSEMVWVARKTRVGG